MCRESFRAKVPLPTNLPLGAVHQGSQHALVLHVHHSCGAVLTAGDDQRSLRRVGVSAVERRYGPGGGRRGSRG